MSEVMDGYIIDYISGLQVKATPEEKATSGVVVAAAVTLRLAVTL